MEQAAKLKPSRDQAKTESVQDSSGPSLADLFRALVAVLTLALLWRWRQKTGESPAQPRTRGGFGPYAGTPVHLGKTPGVDPATLRQEHTFLPLGISDAVPAVPLPMLNLDEDDPRRVAAEIEALTSKSQESFKVKEQSSGTSKAEKLPLLPGELAPHFAASLGERVAWHAQLGAAGQDGTVALTNKRFVALYRKRVLKIFPPHLETETRRHQYPLATINGMHPVLGRQPLFLVGAAVTVWWFPFGTIVASAAIGAYLGVTRPELEISTIAARRRYPLPLQDQDSARLALEKLLEEGGERSGERSNRTAS